VSNGFLLREDRFFYDIIDGNNPFQDIDFEYGQVSYVFVGHQLHAEFYGIVGIDPGKVV
jgi:hypothetical protein